MRSRSSSQLLFDMASVIVRTPPAKSAHGRVRTNRSSRSDLGHVPGRNRHRRGGVSPADMDDLRSLTLPLLPLNTGVVLPGMVVTIAVESVEAGAAFDAAAASEGRLLLVPRLDDGRYARVGTVADVEVGDLPGGMRAGIVRGLHRAI